jgi:HemK-related putative methylase
VTIGMSDRVHHRDTETQRLHGEKINKNSSPQPLRLCASVVRMGYRHLLQLRYRLFQRHRHNHLVIEDVAGLRLIVLPGVFNPKLFRSGEFLARALTAEVVRPGMRVLDMGTGSGVGAVFAALAGACVTAVDVNPAAVRCARLNARLHGVEPRIDARQGDLFAPVAGETFDLVLFNPPYYAGEPRDALDQAFRSTGVLERFAAGLRAALVPGGSALLVVSSDMNLATVEDTLARHGFRASVLVRRDLINEIVVVYRFN